jgi:hypothetical protein
MRRPIDFPLWHAPEGEPVACIEKIRLLPNEGGLTRDALEDAALMGCEEASWQAALAASVAGLVGPYRQ